MENLNKIEFQAQHYMRCKEERDDAQEKMDFAKVVLDREMQTAGETKVLVYWDADKSIKVERAERRPVKLDKEKMAEDLDIAVSAIKTELLLKLVEDGKLTLDDYRRYMFEEPKTSVSIRLVNAE